MPSHFAVFAPGRVNLIGEHTDYSGGLVLPVAIEFGVTVSARADQAGIRLDSLALPGRADLRPDGSARSTPSGWTRYVAAAAALLTERGRAAVGLSGTVSSTVPIGAGLSSSAALTVAVGLALCRVAGFEVAPIELARIAQEAEFRAVGVPCGLMDPATSLLGRRGHALLLDCGTGASRPVRLPDGLAIVVLDSGVRHALEHSGYATRRAELEWALPSLGSRRPADVTVAEATAAAHAKGVDGVALRRLRHVVSENGRVRELVSVLESPGPLDQARVGELMRASHQSLRDDFEVSTSELDLLAEIAYDHGAIGARLMGGGFGGSIVALVDEARAVAFAESAPAEYCARSGQNGLGYVCRTADAAGAATTRAT